LTPRADGGLKREVAMLFHNVRLLDDGVETQLSDFQRYMLVTFSQFQGLPGPVTSVAY
jgi:hypothetical protein